MDPTIFLTSISTRCIILIVNVHDILLIKSNIARVKAYLHWHLTIQDLGTLMYFLGIEFTYQLGKLVLNQWKYVIDILIVGF